MLSFTAICMLNIPGPWERWAPVVGLASQPFWIVETYRRDQLGMFVLSIVFCVPWAIGIARHFF